MREVDEEVSGIEPTEDASGLGQLGDHLDWLHPGEEGGFVFERAEPGRVDDIEEVSVGDAIDGALARLVPCACRPVLFLGASSGVVSLEVGFVVHARRDLAVVRRTCRDGDLVAGILKDGTGGVSGVGTFECNLKADVDEILLEMDNIVVVRSARYFCSIAALLRKEAGDFNNRSHGDDAGVGA